MLRHGDGIEKAGDLVAAQDDGKSLRLAAGRDDLFDAPVALERDLVEEADGGDRDEDRTGRELPVLDEMDLVGADFVGPSSSGDLPKWRANREICSDVRALGIRREVADLHILDHATAKRGHGQLRAG